MSSPKLHNAPSSLCLLHMAISFRSQFTGIIFFQTKDASPLDYAEPNDNQDTCIWMSHTSISVTGTEAAISLLFQDKRRWNVFNLDGVSGSETCGAALKQMPLVILWSNCHTHTHWMAGQLAAEGNIENVSAVGLLCSAEVSFCSVILRELKLTHKCWGINAL